MVSEHKKLEKRRCPRCHRDGHDFEALYCKYCGARLRNAKPDTDKPQEQRDDERF